MKWAVSGAWVWAFGRGGEGWGDLRLVRIFVRAAEREQTKKALCGGR